MKLQHLIIIFLIIIIPIILIFSYYLSLQSKTIKIQTDYDGKLIEATKDAIEAFETNTTQWTYEYSTLANLKRRNILASINTFTTSLSNKLGIGGSAKENILNYVPAIVYIMYDGYYIYTPTYVPQTITNDKGVQYFYYEEATDSKFEITPTKEIRGEIIAGKPMYSKENIGTTTYNSETVSSSPWTVNITEAKKTYKHVLKTFVPYSTTYGEYTINYTLDNYVRIYGANEAREGYIIDEEIIIPSNEVTGIKVGDINISTEILSENIPIRDSKNEEIEIKKYTYIYNSNNDKRYYEDEGENAGKFFTIDNNNVKIYLSEVSEESSLAEYKKVLIRPYDNSPAYLELFQLLNKNEGDIWYYKDNKNNYKRYNGYNPKISREYDCSAINYYVESFEFNFWVKDSRLDKEEIMSQRRETIIDNINNNLKLSIANYSANSKIDYKLPEISDEVWEQALSNISMITFFQGVKTGLKTYNNYVIVTSTQNSEYISNDSLDMMAQDDKYYHRVGCNLCTQPAEIYKNIEFKVKSYKNKEDETRYYYKHAMRNNEATLECFNCIVNKNNMEYEELGTIAKGIYNTALVREKYIQMSRTRLINSSSIIIESEPEPEPTPEPIQPLQATISATVNASNNNVTPSIAYASMNDVVQITVNVTGGSGNYTYSWDNDTMQERNVGDSNTLIVRVPNIQKDLIQEGYVDKNMNATNGVSYTCTIEDGEKYTQIYFTIKYTG